MTVPSSPHLKSMMASESTEPSSPNSHKTTTFSVLTSFNSCQITGAVLTFRSAPIAVEVSGAVVTKPCSCYCLPHSFLPFFSPAANTRCSPKPGHSPLSSSSSSSSLFLSPAFGLLYRTITHTLHLISRLSFLLSCPDSSSRNEEELAQDNVTEQFVIQHSTLALMATQQVA